MKRIFLILSASSPAMLGIGARVDAVQNSLMTAVGTGVVRALNAVNGRSAPLIASAIAGFSLGSRPSVDCPSETVEGETKGGDETNRTSTVKYLLPAVTAATMAILFKERQRGSYQPQTTLTQAYFDTAIGFGGGYLLGALSQYFDNQTSICTVLNGILQATCGWFAARATTTTGQLLATGSALALVGVQKILSHNNFYEQEGDDNNRTQETLADNLNGLLIPALYFLGGGAASIATQYLSVLHR